LRQRDNLMKILSKKKYQYILAFIITSGLATLYFLLTMPASTGLIKLYYYSIISNVYISIFPHEPALIYYGKLYPIIAVSLVAGIGSVIAGIIDYETFIPILHHRKIRKYYADKTVYTRSVYYFSKYPFLSIVVAALTPIPFYPFKFLSIASKYPQERYLAATFIGRFPRYIYLAAIGSWISIPNWILLGTFVMMFVLGSLGIIRKKIQNTRLAHSRNMPVSKVEEII
jgi:membrane protein YqaA with SNARE-associated domain